MRGLISLLILTALTTVAAPAPASGVFGSRKATVVPADRVEKLVAAARTARADSERLEAVVELREFDAVAYPAVVPALVQALRTDKAVSVRIEAARSLGRVRPLTATARDALFEASLHDSAFRVRWQARTSLTYFTVANVNPYNHASAQHQPPIMPKETITTPPVAGGPILVPDPGSGSTSIPPQSPAGPAPASSGSTNYARPLPKGPAQPGASMPVGTPVAPRLPTTQEPPLAKPAPAPAPVLPGTVPAAGPATGPALNPNPGPWVPAPPTNLPAVPPVPQPVGSTPAAPPAGVPPQGPVLVPPP